MDYPQKNRLKKKLIFASATFFLLQLHPADGFQTIFDPWIPRLSLDGFAGSSSFVQPDLMLPLLANHTNMFFIDAQGKYGNDNAWLASAGAGVRHIINNSQLLGAYVFVDKNVSEEGKSFWYVSPGFETLGTVWDFRINGYIPTSPKKKFLRHLFADDLGNPNFVTFRGHQQFDHQVELVEVVGTGVDAEIGRTIPNVTGLRAYLGGYYFQPKQEDDIKGIEARIEYAMNSHIDLKVWDSYDNNAHNTIGVGVRLSLGGMRNIYPPHCIQSRMVDPVIRNLAAISTGAGVPIVKHKQDTGEVLVRDNIWFFVGNSGPTASGFAASLPASANALRAGAGASPATVSFAQGTFENPFSAADFNQAIIDGINLIAPNANLYFNPGQYHALNGLDPITINAGQSLFGRTQDFKREAVGSVRPGFDGGFITQGQNLFEALILFKNNHNIATGFEISDVSGVIIHNVDIGFNQFNDAHNYDVGITVNNSQNILVDHTVINTLRTNIAPIGIAVNSSSLAFNNSFINNSLDTDLSGNLTAFSIFDSRVSMLSSRINSILFISGDNNFIRTNNAVDITENSQVSIVNSNITSQTMISGNNNDVNSVRAIALQTSYLNLVNNHLDATAIIQQINGSTNQTQSLLITAGLSATTPIIDSQKNIYTSSAIINGDNLSTTSNNSYGIFQDTQATIHSSLDQLNISSAVAGTSLINTATGILLSENGSSNDLSLNATSIVTRATVGINDPAVGNNEATGINVRSADTTVSLLNTNIDSRAIVTVNNSGSAVNNARGFFVNTATALNYDISIIDSRISAIGTVPVGSSGFNSASAIFPLNDPNVTVINTTITELLQP